MDGTQVVIEIPQAAYEAVQEVLVEFFGLVGDVADASQAALHAAFPIALAAAYTGLADQLGELAEHMRDGKGDQPERRPDRFARAAGLVEGITVIRERAARLNKGGK